MPIRLLSTGSNGSNQLGHSGREDTSRFLPCRTPPGLTAVGGLAFGANHTVSLFQTADDTSRWQVWGCGDGQLGQLGDSWAQSDDGFRRLVLPSPPVPGSWTPTHVACGWTTSYIALARVPSPTSHGSRATSLILALGSNDFSELGSGVRGPVSPVRHHWHVFEDETVADLQAGPRHVMLVLQAAVETGWRVLGWGAARHGQLARHAASSPSDELQQRPKAKHPATLDVPSLILSAGDPDFKVSPMPAVALGFAHSAISSPSLGKFYCLGGAPNNAGLHKSPPASSIAPTQSSWHHLFYRLPGSRIAVYGRPSPLTAGNRERICDICTDGGAVEIRSFAAGSEHVVVQTQAGTVWVWGWNEHGNLGNGTTIDGPDPKCVWPPIANLGRVDRALAVWAGCGTSWILVKGEN